MSLGSPLGEVSVDPPEHGKVVVLVTLAIVSSVACGVVMWCPRWFRSCVRTAVLARFLHAAMDRYFACHSPVHSSNPSSVSSGNTPGLLEHVAKEIVHFVHDLWA